MSYKDGREYCSKCKKPYRPHRCDEAAERGLPGENPRRVEIRMPDDLYKKLADIAFNHDRMVAAELREMIRKHRG